MIYQNYRGDFLIVEKFYRDSLRLEPVPVPEHVRVKYFTRGREGVFVAERDGNRCRSCEVSDDGMNLLVYVPLSRVPIGRGELLKVVTEISEDENFPSGEKYVPVPQKTGVILYEGVSDGSGEVVSESVLSQVLHGYSAYELAVQHGYEGTEEEWLEICSPTGVGKVTAEAVALASESAPKVQVETTPDGKLVNLHFVFGIPVMYEATGHVEFSESEVTLPEDGGSAELRIISNLEWKIS